MIPARSGRTGPFRDKSRTAIAAGLALAAALLLATGADEWQERLTAVGVPCGPINDIAQAFDLAERLGLAPVAMAGETPTVAHPIRLSETPATYRLGPPARP